MESRSPHSTPATALEPRGGSRSAPASPPVAPPPAAAALQGPAECHAAVAAAPGSKSHTNAQGRSNPGSATRVEAPSSREFGRHPILAEGRRTELPWADRSSQTSVLYARNAE